MIDGPSSRESLRQRLRERARRRHSRRAVSEVIATILLLALTVVLFASIFAWVSSFPPPPPANSNQFQARLGVTPNATGSGGFITSLSIVHLAGPSVPSLTLIRLTSALFPSSSQFTLPYNLSNGGLAAGKPWNLAQTWTLTSFVPSGSLCVAPCHPFAYRGAIPDTVTVYIYYSTNVLFSVSLPVSVTTTTPAFLAVGTTPTVPVIGGAFTIWASILGVVPAAGTTVLITLSGLPGEGSVTTAQAMTYVAATGLWTYSIPLGVTTSSGTYYAPITATTAVGNGWSGSDAVPVAITPYSTLIGSVFKMGTVAATAKCTGVKAPIAACQAANDYYYIVPITSSPITFGNILLEVLTSTRTVYSATTEAAFAIATTAAPTVVAASWTAAGGAMQMPSSGFPTYTAPTTASTALTTAYEIQIDVGTVNPAGTGLYLLVIGVGAYGSYTSASLP